MGVFWEHCQTCTIDPLSDVMHQVYLNRSDMFPGGVTIPPTHYYAYIKYGLHPLSVSDPGLESFLEEDGTYEIKIIIY